MIKFQPKRHITDFDVDTLIILSMWLLSFFIGFAYLPYLPYYNPISSFLCIVFIFSINCAIFSSYFEHLSLDYDIKVFKRVPSRPILCLHNFDHFIAFSAYFFANIFMALSIEIAKYSYGYIWILIFIIFSFYIMFSNYSSWDKE